MNKKGTRGGEKEFDEKGKKGRERQEINDSKRKSRREKEVLDSGNDIRYYSSNQEADSIHTIL